MNRWELNMQGFAGQPGWVSRNVPMNTIGDLGAWDHPPFTRHPWDSFAAISNSARFPERRHPRNHAAQSPIRCPSPGPGVTRLEPRRLDTKNPDNDVFPVTRARLKEWHGELERMEQMCRTMRSLDMHSRDRKKMKECIEKIKSSAGSLREQMEMRTKFPKLEGLDLVRG